jgi:hypothetical protein
MHREEEVLVRRLFAADLGACILRLYTEQHDYISSAHK